MSCRDGVSPRFSLVRAPGLISATPSHPSADGPLSLEPSSTVLHYAQTVFEGMKAYRHDDGRVTLFRPDMNMKRMNTSAARIALPVRPI